MLDVITENLDVWTTAQKQKKAVGRGRAKKDESYGIKKLRELILELAVRGKLVPQDPNDESASVLLEKIAEEKKRLIEEGKIKKQKALPEIVKGENAFLLPDGWIRIQLDNIGNTNIGLTYSPKDIADKGTPVLRSSNIQNGKIDLQDLVRVDKEVKKNVLVNEGDLLICVRNGSKALVGKTAMIVDLKEEMAFGAFMAIFRCRFNEYVEVFLKSPVFRFFLEGVSTTTINQITQKNLRSTLIPLPPLAEQHRIVAKVDELMALCDQLEQEQADHQATHQTLVETLLNGLVESAKSQAKSEANDQQSTADYFNQLIAEHFDTLFTTEQSINQLKQTILQLAVMGKLVPQDPKDEPASVLLEKIAEEKVKLIEEGKIKKQKALPEIEEGKKLLKLPCGWEQCCFGHIISLVSGQHLKPSEYTEHKFDGMIPYLTGPAEFGIRSPSPTRYTKEHRAIALEGDVLITCKGSGVGKLNIAIERTAISRQLMSIQPTITSTEYVFLLADSLRTSIREKIVGIAIPGISREDVTEAGILLPPLLEQHRIVTKVNKLLILCDSLKANLNQAQTTQTQLADAIVKQAVN